MILNFVCNMRANRGETGDSGRPGADVDVDTARERRGRGSGVDAGTKRGTGAGTSTSAGRARARGGPGAGTSTSAGRARWKAAFNAFWRGETRGSVRCGPAGAISHVSGVTYRSGVPHRVVVLRPQGGGTPRAPRSSMIAGSSGAKTTGTARDHDPHPECLNLSFRHEGTVRERTARSFLELLALGYRRVNVTSIRLGRRRGGRRSGDRRDSRVWM